MAKLIKIIFFLVAIFFVQISVFASNSDKVKPKWVTQSLPESKNGSYIFVRSHGEGSSLAGAKEMAFIGMAQRLENERGLTVNTQVRVNEKFRQTQRSSTSEYNQEITLDVTENGHQLQIVCREIDDYWIEKGGTYKVDVLYTVTNQNIYGGSYDDIITVTSRYGAAEGFMSIIPGVGQMCKGSVTKGCVILGGEALAVTGLLLSENNRSSYVKMMIEQPKYAAEYNALADKWTTGRNMCIGVAAALYIYNLIDAFAATGAKRVIVQRGRPSLAIVPYANNDSMGFGINYMF